MAKASTGKDKKAGGSAKAGGKGKTSSRKSKQRTETRSDAVLPGENKAAMKLLRSPGRSGWFGWAVKRLAIVLAVLIAMPAVLTLIYAPSSVRPVSTLMLAERVSGTQVRRDWISFDEVAPVVWQSVMMSEDGQFCAHHGVDWAQINLVIDDVLEGERPRGASTISMQTVKNLYLWSSRSYIRKVLEVPLAMLVDLVWGKRRLMEIYLNVAEWGPGIYGIEAAAQHHFGRSARRLSRRQAALLAVTLPNPKLRNPRKPTRGMNRLARLVEQRARQSGAYIGCLR